MQDHLLFVMKLIVLFYFSLLLPGEKIFSQANADIDKIKSKLYSLSLESSFMEDSSLLEKVEPLLKTMEASGKWPDINYQNKSAAKWKPAEHWERLLALAISYSDKKNIYYQNGQLKNAVLKGIKYWLAETPIAANYWYNAIGIPGYIGKVYMLMEKELNDSLLNAGVRLMKTGVKPDHYEYYGTATGQNLLWIASAHLYAACLTKDIGGIKRVFEEVAKEIRITENEGIQPDYSFYQHGKQNYAMGYGKVFSLTAARFFYLADKTAFQFPQEKINILSHYLLDGQQWMSRYDYLEYTAMGREISRMSKEASQILTALNWMMEIDSFRRSSYQAFYRRLSGIKEEKPLIGNHYFWRSDLMVHQRRNYYFSLKAASSRISSSETGNGENLKGYFQGNGTYYLIRNGEEYKDIFPVWDWRKIPGLLAKQNADSFPLITWGAGAEGATSFVYGISDSMYGCFAYDFNKASVTAHCSWFFFDNEIVHLAAGINGDSVYQSINQCLLKGGVWIDSSNRSFKKGPDTKKIFHDSVGYYVNSNHFPVQLTTAEQTGSWKSINTSQSSEPVKKNVFSVGINLGSKVVNGSFSYVILPGISPGEFKKYRLQNHIDILKNNDAVQAVYQKNIEQVQAVFFNAGSVRLPWSTIVIKMKRPGLLLIKRHGNKLLIDYSQPSLKKHLELFTTNKVIYEDDEIGLGSME